MTVALRGEKQTGNHNPGPFGAWTFEFPEDDLKNVPRGRLSFGPKSKKEGCIFREHFLFKEQPSMFMTI